MTHARLLLIGMAVSLASTSGLAETRSFRCKQDLVQLGDSKASTLSRCGEPVMKDSFCRKPHQPTASSSASPRGTTVIVNVGCDQVDDWTYNPGVGQFMTTLRFEEGVLTSIKYGPRVTVS